MKGYKLKAFTNPLDALSFVREQNANFDLLISDIFMPYMSGVSFYEKLKEMNPSIKVLFIFCFYPIVWLCTLQCLPFLPIPEHPLYFH